MSEDSPLEQSEEALTEPVEIKFGSVVNLEGQKRPMVVVDPKAQDEVIAAGIINADDEHPLLGGPGGHSQPAQVAGEWSLEKIAVGWRNHFGDAAKVMIDELEANSQKPPVMYTGNR